MASPRAARRRTAESAFFVDGAEVGDANVTLAEVGGTLTIGGSAQNGNHLTGELDELQVSNAARSTEWLKAAARSQGMVAPLVVYGGDAQKEGGGEESYFTTTLRNVTIDGWVIIAILAVMFVAVCGCHGRQSAVPEPRRARQREVSRRIPPIA